MRAIHIPSKYISTTLVHLLGGQRKLPIVLRYDGVKANSQITPWAPRHTTCEDFSSQMDYINRSCNIVSLREIVHYCSGTKAIPRRSVGVTFDHGYEKSFRIARPLLEEYSIPATFFHVPNFVDSDELVWTDKIRVLVCNLEKMQKNTETLWNKINDLLKGYGRASASTLVSLLINVPKTLKDEIIICLENTLGWTPSAIDYPDLKRLTSESLHRIEQSHIFDVGTHGSSYEVLPQCLPAIARQQICTAQNKLSNETRAHQVAFAYPSGNLNLDNKTAIAAEGFVCGVTSTWGLVKRGDPFEIPRITVGPEFACNLGRFKASVAGILPQGVLSASTLTKFILKQRLPKKVWERISTHLSQSRKRRRQPTQRRGLRIPSLTCESLISDRVRHVHFVCQGNICRSAFASAYFSKTVGHLAMLGTSSGLWAMEGRRAHLYAIEVARLFDVSLESHLATKTSRQVLQAADLIVCFENWHVASCLKLDPSAINKICLLGTLRRLNMNVEIQDPFEFCFDEFQQSLQETAQLTALLVEKLQAVAIRQSSLNAVECENEKIL